eukprot:c25264_g3_i1 orf=570-1769(+)
MGVQFMQSESLYSQLFQFGNLLHIGQHEACHNRKHGGEASGGYFKQLLEGEEASISDTKPLIMRSFEINGTHGPIINHSFSMDTPALQDFGASEESHQASISSDTKPLLMRPSFEIKGTHGPINGGPANHTFRIDTPPLRDVGASKESPQATGLASPISLESKPSINGPLKRARESSHIEGQEGYCKREKRASEEREMGKKAGGGGGGEALAGQKVTSVKTKAPKPAPLEPPKTDYVHVRARRGQATDSHSLAERVRREKISERMRFLQDLVPGCNKITGKAMILDEIINYVQSLQNQVEFLAMRLATINPKLDHINLGNFTDEEIASPFVEEVKECIDMLPRNLETQARSSDLQFESLPAFYYSLFDEANFNTSIVSDLSTSTCNDSNLTSMNLSHLS